MQLRRVAVYVIIVWAIFFLMFSTSVHSINAQRLLIPSLRQTNFLGEQISIYGAMWNKDESRILTWSGAIVNMWDAETGENLLTLRHDGAIYGALWNKDESRI